jgi:hypothetical protein
MRHATLKTPKEPGGRVMAAIVLGVVVAAGGCVTKAEGQDRGGPVSTKMLRQIGVMEKIVDKVLLDSPNFLVRVGDNTRGLLIPEYGVVFTLDASLTSGVVIPDLSKMMNDMKDRFDVHTDKDGNSTIVIKNMDKKKDKKAALKELEKKQEELDKQKALSAGEDSETPETPEPPDTPPTTGKTFDLENFSISSAKEAAALYSAGKEELIQALLDYGDTLTSLRNGQNVMIAAFMRDSDYFKEQKISRLILHAKIDDLRALGEGTISEKEARSRIVIEEY